MRRIHLSVLLAWFAVLLGTLVLPALPGCVSYDAFIAQKRTACIAKCHAEDHGWRIECYERSQFRPRMCDCTCPPREAIP